MRVPTLLQAQGLLSQAQELNPGPWVRHSIFVGEAAKAIAAHHPRLEPTNACVMGCLHDIGRRVGVTNMRHVIDGYFFLHDMGFEDAARICLTHSFPIQNARFIVGKWDCSAEELRFVDDYLSNVEYTDYDRLIQLCDALALPSGFCLMEKRLVDVALRHGTTEHTIPRWKATFDIQHDIEVVIEQSIYNLLPGVVENTFGFDSSL